MRISLAVEGTRGDVYPMLGLGAELERAGHEVVVCAPPGFRAEVQARGFAFRPVGADVHAIIAEIGHALGTGGWKAAMAARAYFFETLEKQFAMLPPAVEGSDRLIAAGTQMAAASVAEFLGIPFRYVAYCPALLPSTEHPPFLIPNQNLPRWVNWLWWRLLGWGPNRLLSHYISRERRRIGLPRIGDPYSHLLTERPILAADAGLAPLPADGQVEVIRSRCLHPEEDDALPEKLESFLAAGPPPVYFGFGSMTDADPAATTRTILDAVDDVGCRALLSKGWAGLFDGPLPEGVLPIGSVPHHKLFPRLSAIVHHGGAGTTTTAARAGVPQILVPHVFDQFYWGKRIASLGLGPAPLPKRSLDSIRIAEALRATVDNELVSENAAALGEELRQRAESPLDLTPFIGD